jgi:1-acyl-sn-glycerol-3-phosphate acyltransferase
MGWFYYVLRTFSWFILKTLTRYRVRGRENIPASGPLLVVSNHLSNADPLLIAASFRRKAMFMAKKELFRSRFVGAFIGSGAFPINRGKMGARAMRQSLEMLAGGGVLAVFPEGMRSPTSQLGPAMPGVALIAVRSGAPVLPVAITGTEQFGRWNWLWRRPVINITIGPSLRIPPPDGKLTKEKLAELTDGIMNNIAAMLPPQYRGQYGEGEPVGT